MGDTALKQHYVLFETGGRNVEESAPHWGHVSHLSWLNAPSYNRFVYVTCVPGGTLASLALRERQQKQDETRRVKLLLDLHRNGIVPRAAILEYTSSDATRSIAQPPRSC